MMSEVAVIYRSNIGEDGHLGLIVLDVDIPIRRGGYEQAVEAAKTRHYVKEVLAVANAEPDIGWTILSVTTSPTIGEWVTSI